MQSEVKEGSQAEVKAEVTVSDRSTSFSAADDSGPPASMKTFGVIFGVLWLGMLALVFLARRRQLRLKEALGAAERILSVPNERG